MLKKVYRRIQPLTKTIAEKNRDLPPTPFSAKSGGICFVPDGTRCRSENYSDLCTENAFSPHISYTPQKHSIQWK